MEENQDSITLIPRDKTSKLIAWSFIRDQFRYGDFLLHCTVPRQLFANASAFYDEECLSLYDDSPIIHDDALSLKERTIVERVQLLHEDLNHASAYAMIRTLRANCHLNVSADEVMLWKKLRGDKCRGCIRGKLTEHCRRPTTIKETFSPGEAVGGDLMFVELRDGNPMKPLLVTVDVATQLGTVTTLNDRSTESLLQALSAEQAAKKFYGKPIKTLFFDREPSIITIATVLQETLGIKLEPKSAGQHVGIAERYVRMLKDNCRATKLGVIDKYSYIPPTSWNLDLILDVNSCLNMMVKNGREASPYELFTGKPPDTQRGIRGLPWGSVVLTKPPKTHEASKINTPKADYSIVVRLRDRAGVIKVYQIETVS